MSTYRLRAHYYQQFDADFTRDVPAEGYGGWQQTEVDIAREHTALVVMHAWDTGTRENFPGWHRAVEYMPRANQIARTVFPDMLRAVRQSDLPVLHVVGGGDYYSRYPGYQRAVDQAGDPAPPLEQIAADPVLQQLRTLRRERVFVGPHNEEDVRSGFARLDFIEEARPQGEEGVAENAEQLFALCKEKHINHLIYAGFAINWCLLLSPGGMADMSKRGLMCSALRQAVTAVENRETAREEWCKEIALWRVALAFGFVFDVGDLCAAVDDSSPS